jgi:hypothetical protein
MRGVFWDFSLVITTKYFVCPTMQYEIGKARCILGLQFSNHHKIFCMSHNAVCNRQSAVYSGTNNSSVFSSLEIYTSHNTLRCNINRWLHTLMKSDAIATVLVFFGRLLVKSSEWSRKGQTDTQSDRHTDRHIDSNTGQTDRHIDSTTGQTDRQKDIRSNVILSTVVRIRYSQLPKTIILKSQFSGMKCTHIRRIFLASFRLEP